MIIRQLTKAEELIMKILWQMGEGVVKDIIFKMPDPKPAYSTVSTVIRILESKGFIDHRVESYSHIYFPLVQEKDYKHFALDSIMNGFFQNSYHDLLSFLVSEKKLEKSEIEELSRLVEKLKKKK